MHRIRLLTALLFSLSLVSSGCELADPSAWGASDRYREDFTYDFKLPPGGHIEVQGFDGAIEVVGWDGDAVQVRGAKYASRQETLGEISVDARGDAHEVRLRAVQPRMNCNCGVSFTLRVPRKVTLDRIESTNGSVHIESISGDARLRTTNGSIKLFDLTGAVEASTSNGSIDGDRLGGTTVLHTTNGRIHANLLRGAVEATTTNSAIDVSAEEADPRRPIVLSSTNGSITFTLATWKGNEIRATTSNSSITLKLPDPIEARIRASTTNGHIDTDYEVTTSHLSRNSLEGRIGQGGALIEVHSTNGSIRIVKR
jgi:hypothetical protein